MFNMMAGLLKGVGSMANNIIGMLGGGEEAKADDKQISPMAGPAYQATGISPEKKRLSDMDITRLGQAFGTKAAGISSGPQKIGLQYTNAGINAPQLPDPMSMLAGARNMSGQQQNQRNLPITQILNMLRGV